MPELLRNKRVCKLMPGLDTVTGDLKAFKLQHTLIAGTREDTDDILNSLLCHLVMFNKPDNISIEYYTYCNGLDTWMNPERRLPHFRNQYNPRTIDEVWVRLEKILQFCQSKFEGYAETYLSVSNMVLVLNEVDLLLGDNISDIEYRLDLLQALFECGDKIGLKLIVVTNQENSYMHQLLNYFTLRMATAISSEWSDTLFDYNIAKQINESRRHIWVREDRNKFNIQRFKLNYYHETFLNNLCKLYQLSCPFNEWDKINNMRPLSELSATHLSLLIKRMYHAIVSSQGLTSEQMKRVYVKASCYMNCDEDKSVILEDIINLIKGV